MIVQIEQYNIDFLLTLKKYCIKFISIQQLRLELINF